MHIGIVTLFVNDQDRAKNFYTKALGWDVRDDAPMGPEQRWLSVAPPGAQTAIVLAKGFAGWSEEKVGGSSGLALSVNDVFQTAEQLKKNGVAFTTEPSVEFFGGWAAFEDSEGNEIGIHSPPPSGDVPTA
ncbi:MAG: bleomycin resistance protein [Candidatus Meridianibacter frigidus]|nr:MAG: bleomycin resistance protein [Candidatus Eremiobacteraeota bacterium]